MAPTPAIVTDPNVVASSSPSSSYTPSDILDQQPSSGTTSHVGVGIGIAILVLAISMTITTLFYVFVIKRRKQARCAQQQQQTSHYPKENPPPYSPRNITVLPRAASTESSNDGLVKEPKTTYKGSQTS